MAVVEDPPVLRLAMCMVYKLQAMQAKLLIVINWHHRTPSVRTAWQAGSGAATCCAEPWGGTLTGYIS